MPSSFIDAIAYNRPTERLRVRLLTRTGHREIYEYHHVPEDVADEFGEAFRSPDLSAGRFFNENVRDHFIHRYVR